ncbi:hypothetical protein A6R68_13767, partial [Neotoma lepida]
MTTMGTASVSHSSTSDSVPPMTERNFFRVDEITTPKPEMLEILVTQPDHQCLSPGILIINKDHLSCLNQRRDASCVQKGDLQGLTGQKKTD